MELKELGNTGVRIPEIGIGDPMMSGISNAARFQAAAATIFSDSCRLSSGIHRPQNTSASMGRLGRMVVNEAGGALSTPTR